jgi:ubiquinone biosynthesis protein
MDLRGMVRDFAKSLSQELDYHAEAANMERFRRNFEGHENIHIPEVHDELSTEQVLVMEFIEGRTFQDIVDDGESTDGLVHSYFDIAYKMLFLDGFFHGDLHPGNVLILEDDRLGILDCGMVGRLSPSRKDKVIDILYAVINEDLEGVARTVYALAIPEGHVDYPAFEADAIAIAERYLVGVPMSQIHIGELFSALVAGASKHKIRMPTDFTMMFKAILTTEGLAKAIAPNVDPVEIAKPYITQMIKERYSPERLKQVALNDFQLLSEAARRLPTSLPMLLDGLHSGRLAFGVGEDTLEAQKRAADLRTGRVIRATFAVSFWLCGTFALLVESLPVLAWGVPYISVIFWGFAAFWSFTLLRRGGLV